MTNAILPGSKSLDLFAFLLVRLVAFFCAMLLVYIALDGLAIYLWLAYNRGHGYFAAQTKDSI